MIPRDFITEWRAHAPWVTDRQVEQDLVISRALVELFSRPAIANSLAFRGGTALYKLHLRPAARYSEDIDLVQTSEGGIGAVLDAIHGALDGWLGPPKWKHSEGRVTLSYRFESEELPPVRLKLKVEINTREHFTVYGLKAHRFEVASRWFSGAADLRTYELDELLGTKMRALYQRKKGRDLFDLALALRAEGVSPARVVAAFSRYMAEEEATISRALFEQNLHHKRSDPVFTADMSPLLATGQAWSFDDAYELVFRELIGRLPGAPWQGR
ncbi:MAG: nucleotidyl transferase AbiEii/AbiGii toxin family protein [Myxococcaceae bacterium]|nr:nucleotidyl transferase AbiEii/AbiGii toxin family protein [Myxococcaceae bacterium]